MPGPATRPGAEYGPLVGGTLKYAGTDQGIDFTGQGPVYALGPGTITAIRRGNAGFNDGLPGGGNELVYSLSQLGKYVYVAEDFIIRNGLKVGDPVTKGQVLGNVNSAWPGIEVGFSSASGSPLQPLQPRGSSYPSSGLGAQFQALVKGTPQSSGGGGSGVLDAVGRELNALAQDRFTPGGKQGAGGQALGAAEAVPKFLGRLTDPNLWIRILEVVGGAVIGLAGVILLVKNVGLGVPTAEIPQVAQTTASLAEKPTSELSNSSMRRLERETRP